MAKGSGLAKAFGFGWRRAGDLSVLAWLFPSVWSWIVTVIAAIATAVIGVATHAPMVLWVPLALIAAAAALLVVHLFVWLRGRHSKAEERPAAKISGPAILLASEAPSDDSVRIKIVIASGAPFDFFRQHLYTKNHLVRLGVHNSSSRQLTNCELLLTKISGQLAQRCPVTIRSGFSLNPGATEYIDFVDFDETTSGPPANVPPGIVAHFPINQLSDGRSFLDDQPYDLTLQATAAESSPDVAVCTLAIVSGVLTLKRAAPNNPVASDCDTPIWKVVRYVGEKYEDSTDRKAFAETRGRIRKALLNGMLRAEGRREFVDSPSYQNTANYSEVHTDIPASYWATAELNAFASCETYDQHYHTDPESARSWGPRGWDEPNHYADLRLNFAEVQKLWP